MVNARQSTATPQLSRERIAATALDLLDRDGLDALSMRRLADELGAGTMTLYGYFRNKEELLDGVMDFAAPELGAFEPSGSWRDRAAAIARATRASLERHPALIQIRLRRPLVRPGQFSATEASVAALIESGLAPADAARAFRTLFTYTFGFVAFSPTATADDARREMRVGLAALPPDEYPTITSMVDEAVDAAAGDEQFDHGLELILDGIEARLAGGTLDGDGQGQAQGGGG
jgi:AcrR family transcriptional regulator